MKSTLKHVLAGDVDYDCLAFVCPGCALRGGSGLHMLPVNTDKKAPSWNFDGNFERPTISPSILTRSGTAEKPFVCHSFLRNGVFEFLNDCTHDLKGQSVEIPDLPDWVTNET